MGRQYWGSWPVYVISGFVVVMHPGSMSIVSRTDQEMNANQQGKKADLAHSTDASRRSDLKLKLGLGLKDRRSTAHSMLERSQAIKAMSERCL